MKTKKNFLKKLTAGILGFVMTLGVGAAGYAGAAGETRAETSYIDFNNPISGFGYDKGTMNNLEYEKNDVTLTASSISGKNGSCIQLVKSGTITSTAFPGTILSIDIADCKTTSTKTDGGFTVGGSKNGSTFSTVKTVTGLSSSENPQTINFTESDGFTYFKITNGSDRVLLTSDIKVTYKVESSITLASITVTNQKTLYTSGDSFVKPTVTATYDNGDQVDVSDDATFTVKKSGETSYGAIPATFDANYDGATIKASFTDGDVTETDEYTISVTAPRELLSISVSGTPTKTTYYVGDDFDPAGLVVTGYYDSGDSEPITEGIEFVSDPETFTSTSQTSVEVLASYGDFTSEPYPVNGLTVQEKPKEFVATFAEGLNNTNGTDATDTTLKSNFGYSIDTNLTFGDISKLYGQQDQALKFGASKSAGSFSISIPSTYQGKSIHIASVLLKAAYYGSDETTFTVEGNDVELTSSLAEYTVNFTAGNLTKINFSTVAAKRVYFSEIKVRYDVNKSLSSISVSNNHRSFDYKSTFVPETVTATYSDGSSSEVTPTSITSPNMSTLGNQTISVSYTDSYGSASTSYIINVHYATVTSVTVSPNTYSLGVSGTLDLTTIDVTILPDNADQSTFGWTIDPESKNPSTMDCSLSGTTFSAGNVPGTVDLICTAGDKSDELAVTISAGALISLDKTEVEGIANISSDVEVNATIYNYQSVTSITWTSNDEDVASVSGTSTKGTIKFLHEGSATVTCTAVVVNLLGVSETVSETVTVTVTKQLKSISAELTDPTKTYPENTNVPASDLTVTATYSDGQTASVDTTGFTVSEPLVTMEDNSIKVSCTQGGVTVHTNVTVTVVPAVLDSLSFTARETTFNHGDKFTIGASAVVTAKYKTSFSDETLVSNGVIQSNLRGTLTFKLMSKNGDVYTEVATLVPGTTEMLRSYNGLYTRAYYTYEGSTKYSQAQAIQVSAPRTTVDVTEDLDESWSLVSAASQLEEDAEYVIAASGYNVAMSDTQNSNNRGETSITKSGSTISWTETSNVQVFTLKEGNTTGSWAFYTGSGYIYAASSSSNYLRTESDLSDNSSFKIEFTNGATSIVAQGSNSRNVLQYNQGSSCFACYGSASQKAVVLYKLVGGKTTTPYAISEDLYDAIAALPSPLTSDNWSSLSSLSSFVESGKESTNDYKALKLGKAKTDGNMAEQFLAAYDSICGPQELYNYLGRTTLDPQRTIAYGNVDGATLTGGTIAGSYKKGSTINLPTASKTGYNNATWWTLDGTSTGNWGSQVTTSFSLENNTTLYAKWIPISYKITYELKGGTNHEDNPSTYTIEDEVILEAPSKNGCQFVSWSNGGIIEKGSTGDKTFTASWDPLPFNVSFDGGGHVTSDGESSCLFGSTYEAKLSVVAPYHLPSSITVMCDEQEVSCTYDNNNGEFSFIMPAGDVEITARASANATISYAEVDGTAITGDYLVTSYEEGKGVTLVNAHDKMGYKFGGWYENTDLSGSPVTVISTEATGNKIFYAKWIFAAQDSLNCVTTQVGMSYKYTKDGVPNSSSSNSSTKTVTKGSNDTTSSYTKITSTSDLTDGKYLIVYEAANVALNGLLTSDVASNTVDVTISNNKINGSQTIDAAAVTINTSNGSILGGGGKYIGHSGTSNTLNYSNNALTNTITFDNGNVVFTNGDYVMRYNNGSGQYRFRYYKSGQQAIQLYKQDAAPKLDHIAIEGTPTTTTYSVGQAYSADGLHIEAYYDNNSHKTVSGTITIDKDIAKKGDTSITYSASYTEDEITETDSLGPVSVTVNSVYTDVMFRFTIKQSGMDQLVDMYRNVFEDIGIVVSYNGKTRHFSYIKSDDGKYYMHEGNKDTAYTLNSDGSFSLNLGDAINTRSIAEIKFTIKVYAKDSSGYHYSDENVIEDISLLSWLNDHNIPMYQTAKFLEVYQIFFPEGK